MARAKDLQRQERREKQIRKRVIIGVLIGLAVICIGVAAYFAVQYLSSKNETVSEIEWDPNAGMETVATIDGNKVTEAEFTYYFLSQISMFEQIGGADIWDMDFDGEAPENYAKQKTLEDIRIVKECAKRAKEMGLSPSSEKMTEIDEAAAYYESIFTDNIKKGKGLSLERLKEILTESEYSSILFEKYTADYVPDSPDYDSELARMTEEETQYYESQLSEEDDPFTEEELQQIADRVETYYLTQLKNQYFETIYSPWVENISIDINHEVFDRITKASLAQ